MESLQQILVVGVRSRSQPNVGQGILSIDRAKEEGMKKDIPTRSKGRKDSLDEYRDKSSVHLRLPKDIHDLLHGIPIPLITSDVTQVFELEL